VPDNKAGSASTLRGNRRASTTFRRHEFSKTNSPPAHNPENASSVDWGALEVSDLTNNPGAVALPQRRGAKREGIVGDDGGHRVHLHTQPTSILFPGTATPSQRRATIKQPAKAALEAYALPRRISVTDPPPAGPTTICCDVK
jgi:hypothetical protein